MRTTSASFLHGLAALSLTACLPLAMASCDCDDNSNSESTNSSITINEERSYSFDDSAHDWNSSGPVARVRLEIDDFHHGDLLITIYDALGRVIFSKLYWTFDWFWYIDGEFTDIDFTEHGEPGLWTILLEYSEFTGDVTLVVETTEEVPDEPQVPPPTSNSDLLDPSYGVSGRIAYGTDTAGGRRLTIDSQGRTVVCGSNVNPNGIRSLGVWRFTPGGQLDSTFGSNGVFLLAAPDVSASGGFDIALNANDDGILASGWVAGSDRRTDLAVVRLTSAGALDPAFGSGGIARIDDGQDENGPGLARDSAGRIYVAGASRAADNSSGHLILARFLESGLLDASFGGTGIVRTTGDPTDRGLDVAIQSGGQPVVLGSRANGIALWRFTEVGALDVSFGSGGVATSAGPAEELRLGRSLTISGDGSLAVAGVGVFAVAGQPSEALVWRYTPNGFPLTTFNGSGFLAYRYPNGSAAASGIAFDPQNRILVSGGTKGSGGGASASLWRYFASGTLDGSLPGSEGTGLARFDVRRDPAGTSASTVVVAPPGGSAFATGSAFGDTAIDLVVWKLKP